MSQLLGECMQRVAEPVRPAADFKFMGMGNVVSGQFEGVLQVKGKQE